MAPASLLQKQLEHEKFLHAAAYVENNSHGLKKLNTNELAYLNQLVRADHGDEPWRFTDVEIQLPGGQSQHFNVHSNPINRAREILGDGFQIAANDDGLKGATFIYSNLILEHLFLEANRRTAALACLWCLRSQNQPVDSLALLKIPVGNLRTPEELVKLNHAIAKLISAASKA